MKILVIGGTRFMGPHVVRSLNDQGHDITVFHRGQTQTSLPAGVKEILGDRHPFSNVANELKQLAPDVVLDMLPLTEQDARDVMNTFTGTAHRVVALSSQDVYHAFGLINHKESGPVDALPLTEDSPLRKNLYPYRDETSNDQPREIADYDKILVERIVMSDPNLPGTVLRLPAVYGPGDFQHRLFSYIKRMDDHRPAILLDEAEAEWRWTHGYVENVAEAIALAVTNEQAAGRIYNVGEPYTLTMAEWVRKIGQTIGWEGRIVFAPQGRLPEPIRWGINADQDIVVDSTRIRQELGYQEHISPEEALKQTIAWERANPPQKIDPKQFDYETEDSILAEL